MAKETTAGTAGNEDEIDLRELLGTLVDRKWWILGTTAVFFVLSVAYALLAAPVYRAQAMVQVEAQMPSIPGLSDLTSLAGAGSVVSTTEIALLRSRTVVGAAVDQLRLDIEVEPRTFPLLGGFLSRRFEPEAEGQVAAPFLGLSGYGWGGELAGFNKLEVPAALVDTKLELEVLDAAGGYVLRDEDGNELVRGKVGETAQQGAVLAEVDALNANPGMVFKVVKHRRLDVLAALQQDIGASEQGKDSGILQVTYEDTDPARAEAVVQKIIEAYVRQNVERSSAEAAAQLQFVKDQLPTVRKQVEDAQDAMARYQSTANSVDITMQTKGLLEQEVAVETSIQQLRLKQAELDRSYTRDHPGYRALLSQIGELEARKAGFRRQVSALPDTQQELLRLTRDLQVSNELYTALLNQAQQLDVARAGTVGNVRIVDPAVVNTSEPVKPRKALVVLVATLLGAFLAIALVFVQRMLNPGIEDPAVIEELGLPVYAAIPLSDSKVLPSARRDRKGLHSIRADGRQHLLAVAEPADLAVEALRSLRTSLHFAMLESKNNILAISGPRPGVGKTFVSANLAAVIAQAGQRVLVIDADMRKGTLHKLLGIGLKDGLSDVLAGKVEIEAAIHEVPGLANMHYMVRGDIPPNPSELLMHPRFGQVLETLAPRYDLVIVDTPPILAVTDPAIVGAHAGASLLVTRFGLNQAKEILLTLKRFEQNGVHIKGTIFNAVEKRATGYYSYGYYDYKSGNA